MINKKYNESGIILLTVIMLVMAMSTLAIGIFGVMGSQGLLGQNQVDKIKAEQLAKGATYLRYMNNVSNAGTPALKETLDGKDFTITFSTGGVGSGPENTTPHIVSVAY